MPTAHHPPDLRDVVDVSERDAGFAYRPRQVLVRGLASTRRAVQLSGRAALRLRPPEHRLAPESIDLDFLERFDPAVPPGDGSSVAPDDDIPLTPFDVMVLKEQAPEWYAIADVDEPLALIDMLNAEGFVAQPNHVFVAHGCGTVCRPHPSLAQTALESVWADPLRANPLRANPLRANPLRANPLRMNPLRMNPLRMNALVNTAVPGDAPALPARKPLPPTGLRVVVLDTGLPGGQGEALDDLGNPTIVNYEPQVVASKAATISGQLDQPDVDIEGRDGTTFGRDGYLDPVAGHGGFIAGIIDTLAPGVRVDVRRVIQPLGDVDEASAADAIGAVAALARASSTPTIVTMSFGGPVMGEAGLIGDRIAEALADPDTPVVFIASAGNDGVCTPNYPAAFDGVIAVGALGPDGPAEWSNYGDWVDVCAPGTDLVSWFFDNFDGRFPMVNTQDADRFTGTAVWSGTSFAVPVVAARIATEFAVGSAGSDANGDPIGITLDEAVNRVVDDPNQMRIPCLGTVVPI